MRIVCIVCVMLGRSDTNDIVHTLAHELRSADKHAMQTMIIMI